MGIYDRIKTPVACPQCGRHSMNEIQTKDLKDYEGFGRAEIVTKKREELIGEDATLLPEEFVNKNLSVDALFKCKSRMCLTIQNLKDVKKYGTVLGFGLSQDVEFRIRKGYISGEVTFKNVEMYSAEEIQKMKEYLKDEYPDIYELGMERYGLLVGVLTNWTDLRAKVTENDL